MATEERKKDDLYIKAKRRAKNFFVTGSNVSGEVNKTTISSSVYNKMSESFADGEHLIDDAIRETQGAVLYMLQEMQKDIDDVYNEVSASSFQASFFPFASIQTGSIGVFSGSLIPDADEKHDLGSSTKEWHTSYMSTASIGGGLFTSASLASGGGGTADFSSVGENIIPDSDNARDLGSSTKEFRNLYIDGTAYIDSIAGGSLTTPIRTVLNQVTAMKNTTLDAQQTDVFEFNIAKAVTVDLIVPSFPGQEITIMNIGSGAITITGAQSPKQTGIYNAKGANYTINQHQAYKFVVNSNQVWYVL